jgi:hypothetical protein
MATNDSPTPKYAVCTPCGQAIPKGHLRRDGDSSICPDCSAVVVGPLPVRKRDSGITEVPN